MISSDQRAQQFLQYFLKQLEIRKGARARLSQIAHFVWDLKTPMSEEVKTSVEKLAQATGFSALLIQGKATVEQSPKSQLKSEPTGEPLVS